MYYLQLQTEFNMFLYGYHACSTNVAHMAIPYVFHVPTSVACVAHDELYETCML